MTSRASLGPSASTLLDHIGPHAASSAASRTGVRILSVAFVTALTAAAAQLSFPLPFTPVPFTMQPVVVLLGAAALGSRLGALSQVSYLMLGLIGLPVFAFSPELPSGLGRLLGPTGGYLMAYPVAAAVTGWLAERGFDRRYGTSVLAMGAGLAVIFTGGVLWLATTIGWRSAIAVGFEPFIAVDVVKVLAVGMVLPTAWRLFGPAR